MHTERLRTWGRAAVACAFSTALALTTPGVGLAATKEELQQQMTQAQDRIATLSSEAEVAEYELIAVENELRQTNDHIDELDGQIPQTQAELDEARGELSVIVSDNYKAGTPTLLDVIVDSVSFDDFLSRVEYANRVSEHKRQVVAEVKDLSDLLEQQKSDLEVEKATQEDLVVQQQQRVVAAEAAANEAQSYYNSLSSELQQMIAEEEAAKRAAAEEAAREAAAEAQRKAEAEAAAAVEAQQQREREQGQAAQQQAQPTEQGQTEQRQTEQDGQSGRQNQQEQSARTEEPAQQEQPSQAAQPAQQVEDEPEEEYEEEAPASTPSSSSTSSSDSSSSASTSAPAASSGSVSAFVANAFSIIGAGYQYSGYTWTGSVSSSAFTCSGVVDFARGMGPRSSSPESLMAEVGSRMVYSTSQLNYGDLVFYNCLGRYPGHVGIYIGNGQVIDSIPNGGVAIRDVAYMDVIGGGPIY